MFYIPFDVLSGSSESQRVLDVRFRPRQFFDNGAKMAASVGVRWLSGSDRRAASSSSSSNSRFNILAAVLRPEAKLEQMRCSRSDLINPAALVRCCNAVMKSSAV